MLFRETLFVRLWSLRHVPLLFSTRPTVLELNDERCSVLIKLRRKTRNHLGSMYFGALCAGADCAGGLMAMRLIRNSGNPVSLIFKDVRGEFHKRAEGDVVFTCVDGAAIHGMVERVMRSGERENMPVRVIATVPSLSDEPVATFELTLSLKRRDIAAA